MRVGATLLCVLGVVTGMIGCAATAKSQSAAADPVANLSVTFGGAGFHIVEMDGYGAATEPHWPVRAELPAISPDLPEYYRIRGSPVAWVRRSTPEATIEADVPQSWNGEVSVTGTSAEIHFSGAGEVIQGRLRVRVRAAEPLPDHVASFDSMTVRWTVAHESGSAELGVTSNPIYVLLGPPTGPLVHTPVHVASRAAAGLADTTAIVDAVWAEFADRDVRRVRDDMPLRYYGLFNDKAPAELRGFLVSGTGQCVAWSYFLHSALAAHGVPSRIVLISPPQRGRIYVGSWGFAAGRRFVDAGPNGVVETAPEGDDVAFFPAGTSVPGAPVFRAGPLAAQALLGDDEWFPQNCPTCVGGFYMSGPDGLTDTRVDADVAVPVIPRGFGLESQRIYELLEGTDPSTIRLGGDDQIVRQLRNVYVMSGPNGIVETERQDGMKPGRATGSQWDPVLGRGPTSIRFPIALARAEALPPAAGDDVHMGWWLDGGDDGVSQTPGANLGMGTPYVIGIGAGPNGRIDSRPRGDDRIVDLSEILDLAPEGYDYVSFRNTWPIRDSGGQSNVRPPTDYPNHVIVQVGGRYFDPSYGTGPFLTQLEWERASLAGVGIRVMRDGEAVMFNGRIQMVTRRSNGMETLTSFGTMLPPS